MEINTNGTGNCIDEATNCAEVVGDDTGEKPAVVNLQSEQGPLSDNSIIKSLSPVGDSESTSGCEPSRSEEAIAVGTPDLGDSTDSRRKFRVLGLTLPGKWMDDEVFFKVLGRSESIRLWFDRAAKGNDMRGGADLIFETPQEAKDAFASIQKMPVEGDSLLLQASKHFYDDAPDSNLKSGVSQPTLPFEVDASHADAPRRLYALHLTSSTDQTLLFSIIDKESIEAIRFESDPNIPSEKQAEIVFRSEDEANAALMDVADGFEIDEGDRKSTIVLLTAEQYLSRMKNGGQKCENASVSSTSQINHASPSSNLSAHNAAEPLCPAPELDVEDVVEYLQKYIDVKRTNWAELNASEELWALCDEVSQQYNGIPDSLLKPALLTILERHLNQLTPSWMREHLEELIKLWKREVQNAKRTDRTGAFVMSAPSYSPPPRKRRRKTMSENKKNVLKTMMSVGEMLNTVRAKLATEEGELEVDEDEHGNYSVEGRPLSFEYWAELYNKPSAAKEAEQVVIQPQQPQLRTQHKKEVRRKKMEEKKMRKMREGLEITTADESEALTDAVDESSTVEFEAPEPEKKRELEEGEMASDSSSSSTASSSSDEEHTQHTSRDRRRKRRSHKKQTRMVGGADSSNLLAPPPQFTAIFSQLYDQRISLARTLSAAHKQAFASVLNQIVSSPLGMTSVQESQMMLFMHNFSSQNFISK